MAREPDHEVEPKAPLRPATPIDPEIEKTKEDEIYREGSREEGPPGYQGE